MSKTKTITRIFLIAAVVAMLAITAYAADLLHVKSLLSGHSESYSAYSDVKKAMRQAGMKADVQESFDSGFKFTLVRVGDTDALDENGSKLFTYKELSVHYQNEEGVWLTLCANPDLEGIPETKHAGGRTREIGGVTATYWQDHYKLVPEDYEPTEADKVWMEQPGNFLSYGSDEVQERTPGFLAWKKDGIRYFFMDSTGRVSADTLFAMAEELILGK